MTNVRGLSLDRCTSAAPDACRRRMEQSTCWPFKAEDHSILTWWRTLPPDSISVSDRELLLPMLRQIAVLHGDSELVSALRGDADAAIGAAFAGIPIRKITLQTDIAMTTVLSSALRGSATSALVMTQVLGLTGLGHPFGIPLAARWFAYGLQNSVDPDKFCQAEALLTEAFRERHGDKADRWPQHCMAKEPNA